MIKLIIGGIGSGKTLSAVKEIVDNNKPCFVNFEVNHPKAIRLKEEHIIKKVEIDQGCYKDGREKPKKYNYEVNWDFWNDYINTHGSFDIYIDEAHNVLHSRRSVTKWNVLFTMWLSQIRKILTSLEGNHLYLISQRITGIDVVARELAGEIIYVSCQKFDNEVWIFKTYFTGQFCMESFAAFFGGSKSYSYRSYFYGCPYFKYYNTHSIVNFGEKVYI